MTSRPVRKPSQTIVRRTQSFQVQPSRRGWEDDFRGYSRKTLDDGALRNRGGGGHVARFVQQLEQGIHETKNNYRYFDHEDQRDSIFPNSIGKYDSKQSDHSGSSDVSLNARKIKPTSDDYRLVFISSDSSKTSEPNSSLESDQSPSHSEIREWKKPRPKSMSSFSSWADIKNNAANYESGSSPLKKRKDVVDAAVNTEGDYISEDSSDEEPVKNLVAPLGQLNEKDLKLMLQQTEVVQAEAHALQQALMGAFEENTRSPPPSHWPQGHPQNNAEYANIRYSKDSNIYENFPMNSETTTKNICIQTDFGSSMDEDSDDSSDISCNDSVSQRNYRIQPKPKRNNNSVLNDDSYGSWAVSANSSYSPRADVGAACPSPLAVLRIQKTCRVVLLTE